MLSDAESAFEWFGDPEVMRFIPFGPVKDLDGTHARIGRYMDHQQAHGFSKWIILERTSGEAIGDAGFFLMPDQQRVELGYRISRRFWNQGFATEVATGWLEMARPWFGFTEVFAFAHPDNSTSLRVIEKLGFRFHRKEQLYGMEAPIYLRSA